MIGCLIRGGGAEQQRVVLACSGAPVQLTALQEPRQPAWQPWERVCPLTTAKEHAVAVAELPLGVILALSTAPHAQHPTSGGRSAKLSLPR